jgi:hypothetical protein
MQAEDVIVRVKDYTGGPLFRETIIHVRTKLQTSQLDIDATQLGGSTDALKLTKVGAGKSLNASGDIAASGAISGASLDISGGVNVGTNVAVASNLTIGGNATITGNFSAAAIAGILSSMVLRTGALTGVGAATATLDAGAPVTVDYFKNAVIAIVAGTGVGQARNITGYSAGRVATVSPAWSTQPAGATFIIIPGADVWSASPGTELAAMPTAASTYAQLLQFLFQRFAYKRRQDATSQTLYKSDSATPLASGNFTDQTTYQEIAKLT